MCYDFLMGMNTGPAGHFETERKWMVRGWPEEDGHDLPLLREQFMRQGYVATDPTVRIREEASVLPAGGTEYILCFKSKGRLSRREIEISIERETFAELEELIGLPLIEKVRRTYALPDGLELEVNHVEEGCPGEFWYAEIEYPDEEGARAWSAEDAGLGDYLSDDVTEQKGQSMAAYWRQTRL